MKKLMAFVLAAAVVFAVAGQVQAAALETSGENRVRIWYLTNYLTDKHDADFIDERLRLTMTWPVAEGVKVVARADIYEGFWGDNTTAVAHSVTGDPATGLTVTERFSGFDIKQQITFDHLYMTFPVKNFNFTIGRQDVSWGTGMVARADNRDRFKVTTKFDPVTVGLSYDKTREVFSAHGGPNDKGDAEGVTLSATGTFSGWNSGFLAAFSHDNSQLAVATANLVRYTLGLYTMGKAGPLDVKLEAAYRLGTNDPIAAGAKDVDITGYGAYLALGMPAGPVALKLEGAIAAGDDPKTADNEGGFRFNYHADFNSVLLFNGMDYPGFRTETDPSGDTGLTNAWGAKLSAMHSPMAGLNLGAAVLYAARLEDVKQKDGSIQKADPLGTEIDLSASYSITEAVNVTLGVGYLIMGDFFKNEDVLGVIVGFTTKF